MSSTSPIQEDALWYVEQLRLTALYSDPSPVEELKIWQSITGAEPEDRQLQPRLRRVVESGAWNDGVLTISSMDLRSDLIYSASNSTESKEPILSAGEFRTALGIFQTAVEKWIPTARPASRLAVGVVLFRAAETGESAYRILGTYLPALGIDPVGSRDFLYRINRPRTIAVAGLSVKVNRVSSWSAMVWSVMEVRASEKGMEGKKSSPDFRVRLDLDINTDPEYNGAFDGDVARSVFGELTKLASEIVRDGDKP